MTRLIYLLLVFLFTFINPGKPVDVPADPGSLVVREIRIVTVPDGQTQIHTLRDDASIEAVLYYLRLSEAYGVTGIDPDSFRTEPCEIIVCYFSGEYATYRQINNEYLQIGDGHWLRIHGDDLLFPTL